MESEVLDAPLVRYPASAPEVGPGPSCGCEEATGFREALEPNGHLSQQLE